MKNYQKKMVKKILPCALSLVLTFIFLIPYKSQADLCPIDIHNNANTITLQNPDLQTLLPAGTYYMTIGWQDPNDGSGCYTNTQAVTISHSNSLGSVVSGATGAGIYITITPNFAETCPITDLPGSDGLRYLLTSIVITQSLGSSTLLEVNFSPNGTMPNVDNCFTAIIPVTYTTVSSSYSSSSPANVTVSWTTASESSLAHFSIEKSSDGVNFYKIGEVAATNTSSTHSYSFPDYNPIRRAYYRIAGISIDCYRKYSIIVVNGSFCTIGSSGCATTFTPPSITQDCTPPNNNGNPFIFGISPVCDTKGHLYRLKNVNGEATVTWSALTSGVVTLTPIGRTVVVKKTGTGSSVTIRATVVRYGVTTTYDKTIYFNPQQSILAYWSSSYDGAGTLDPSYYHYDYVSPYSTVWVYSSIPSNQTWTVEDGSIESHGWNPYVHAFEFYMPPNGWGTVRITGNDAGYCPTTATFTFVANSGGRAASDYFAINPSKHLIRVVKKTKDPLSPTPPNGFDARLNKNKLNEKPSLVKVYDIMGNLRKTTTMPANSVTLDIDASNLPSGWYYLHVIKSAKDTDVIKVWVDK